MKKQHRRSVTESAETKPAKSTKSGFSPWPLVAFVVGAGLLVWLIRASFTVPDSSAPSPVAQPTPPLISTSRSAAAGSSTVEPRQPVAEATRQKLLGSWQRTDADYAIEIRLLNPDGTADARYFNPFTQRSIHVAKATLAQKAGQAEFFMELRDEGYPGSTYTLRYDEAKDELAGVYFQAVQQQSFEVGFQRLRGQ